MRKIFALCLNALLLLVLFVSSTNCNNKISESPDEIIFTSFDFLNVNRVVIKDLHNGRITEIVNIADIAEIINLLKTISGNNRMSSKGWYGGIYEVLLYHDIDIVFIIGFGDDDSFNYGVNENDKLDDGTPYSNRYILQSPDKTVIQEFFLGFCKDID